MRRNDAWLFMFAIAVPSAFLMARIYHGLAFSTDSLNYMYAAKSFSQTGVFLNAYTLKPLTIFPPLYPLAIASLHYLGATYDIASIILSISCFVGSIIITYYLVNDVSRSNYTALAASLLIFINPTIQTVFAHAWSEHLYLFLGLSILLVLMKTEYVFREKNLTGSVFLGFLAGATCLVKYSGVSLIATVCATLLLNNRKLTLNNSLNSVYALLASASVIGPWILRNYHVNGTVFGYRSTTNDTVIFAMRNIFYTYGRFVVYNKINDLLTISIGILIVIIVIFTGYYSLCRARRADTIILAPFLLFTIQMAVLVVSASRTAVDPLSARLLILTFVPAVLVLLTGWRYLIDALYSPPLKVAIGGALLLYSSAIAAVGFRQNLLAISNMRPGYGGIERRITEDDLPIECRLRNAVLFSNEGGYLHYYGIRGPIMALPRRIKYRMSTRVADWAEFINNVKSHTVCLVWVRFKYNHKPSVFDLLGGKADSISIEPISANNGLFIYRVKFDDSIP